MVEATLEIVLELERMEELKPHVRLGLNPKLPLEATMSAESRVRIDKIDQKGCTDSLRPSSSSLMLVFPAAVLFLSGWRR